MTDMMKKIAALIKENRYIIILAFCIVIALYPLQSHAALFSFGDTFDPNEYQEHCNTSKFAAKYDGDQKDTCWSCDIIIMMTDQMLDAAEILANASIELGKIILMWGAVLWLAMYFLKALGSLAEQDPAKLLDQVFTFMFKMALVYLLIKEGGLLAIIDYIVNPILEIGMEIGTSLDNLAAI